MSDVDRLLTAFALTAGHIAIIRSDMKQEGNFDAAGDTMMGIVECALEEIIDRVRGTYDPKAD